MENKINFGKQLRISYILMTVLVWQVVVLVGIFWNRIPDEIPTQFTWMGQIQSYGSKTALLMLCGISVMIYVFHLLFINTVPKKTKATSMFGVKLSALADPADLNRGREIIIVLLTCIDAIIVAMLDYVIICSIYSRPVGAAFLPIVVSLIIAAYVWYEHRMKKVKVELENRINRR